MMDMSGEYNTHLPPDLEPRFQEWTKQNNREKDLYDYDMRGWWLENILPGGEGNVTDPGYKEVQKDYDASYQGFNRMADPKKFALAVQEMPMSTNIEDRRGEPLGHLSDRYKKPNHPTFSNESMYHNEKAGLEGGVWQKMEGNTHAFIPGRTNLENFGPEGLDNYFNQFEVPNGNKLLLPKE